MQIKNTLRYIKHRLKEASLFIKEYASSGRKKEAALTAWEGKVLVEAHGLEKGMGLPGAEKGHGLNKAERVAGMLSHFVFRHKRSAIQNFAFRESFRILMAYVEFQGETAETEEFGSLMSMYRMLLKAVGDEYAASVKADLKAGAKMLSKEELMEGTQFDLEAFLSCRHSQRTYEKKPIDEKTALRAAELANMAPSACNRQPSRIYFANSEKTVAKIDYLITGSHGFKGETPNYFVITTHRSYFENDEEFQWYINGGIYLAYFTLALHSLGIGHCIMQWKAFYKTEGELKALLGVSKDEAIIAIVGAGYYADEAPCIEAQRRKPEEVLTAAG